MSQYNCPPVCGKCSRAHRGPCQQNQPGALALGTCSLARLEAEIEHLFATATHKEIETLLKKANFDHYNKIGTDILPPREAPENAQDEPRRH